MLPCCVIGGPGGGLPYAETNLFGLAGSFASITSNTCCGNTALHVSNRWTIERCTFASAIWYVDMNRSARLRWKHTTNGPLTFFTIESIR